MSHDDDTCPHLVRANLLEAKNKKLQTEVDHLMIFCNCTLIPSKQLQADYARLKAEVERLTAFTTRTIIPNEELQAQVERLTKAGDAMADAYLEEYRFNTLMIPPIDPDEVEAWHKAKGVQS